MPNRRRKRRLNYGTGIGERLADSLDTSTEDNLLDLSLDHTDDTLSSLYDTSFDDGIPDLPLDDSQQVEMERNNYNFFYKLIRQKVTDNWQLMVDMGLLFLTTVPSFLLVWNSLDCIQNFLSALLSLGIQSMFTLVISATFTSICLLFISKGTLLNWTTQNVNDSLTYNPTDNQHFGKFSNEKGTQTIEQGDITDISMIKKSFEIKLKFSRRKYLKLKREYARRLAKLKEQSKDHSEFLTRLQLKFPDLERERDLLIAEKEAIEKQHEEEKRRNRELIGRFQRLQQQLGRNGQQHRQILNPY